MDKEYLQSCEANEFINPEGKCLICHQAGRHELCSKAWVAKRKKRARLRKEIRKKVTLINKKELKKYSIQKKFLNLEKDKLPSVQKILDEIRQVGLCYEPYFVPEFKKHGVIESKEWWFFPVYHIGIFAYIYEKNTGNVYCVGSGHVYSGKYGSLAGTIWPAIYEYCAGRIPPLGT